MIWALMIRTALIIWLLQTINSRIPLVIVIDSDDDEEGIEEELEEDLIEEWEDFEGIKIDMEDMEDDPDEILFDDEDGDFDASSLVTIKYID